MPLSGGMHLSVSLATGSEWNFILAVSLPATLQIVALFAFFQRYIVERMAGSTL